ncbi:uncharacterized protein CcaverHIS019_0104970 [Cutaneotrichosporon cavernicola]|uniref:WW domain-containing protein n=1 Tax=Cutaneotrichosporon cavernicola TaxID=279322 RepID=A0AA48I1E5_9TREE|nr:uncharacterized protein CcaverHIS019_0104970 [Cutaneotrichosporon cavernicola]BEI87779.1 hypothetical protein CcaverHIS019_0104970 [Cutaneotrichosporon cavernicola]BEI95551.1 hypothetical protein CcaverHIS631_0105000 [Cutaneotrichosporon cavernicola]BEJ03327.1 hypothetical protein CcaverHIS641_0105020 [Cutaneotrichosporon cavernicola]
MSSGPPGSFGGPPGPPPGGPAARVPPGPPAGGPGFAAPGSFPPGMAGMPLPNFPPPLPPNWSEHRAPDGVTPYYYNTATKASTYTRPTFATAAPAPAAAPKEKKKKKEKPKDRVPIPGTGWTRVTTNEGNVFYFEKETKRSEWTIPDEIAEAVAAFDASEAQERKQKAEEARIERLREQERVRAEVAEERKRKAEEKKRKADAAAEGAPGAKKSKAAEESGGFVEDDGAPEVEDEVEWKRAVAAEFDAVDRRKAADAAKEEGDAEKAGEEAAKKVFAVPEKVQVSAEEGRALFKALLIEKEISPFAPWEQALPLFINDPRYVLLPSMKERRDVYEEYCRTAGRAKRTSKAEPAKAKADPERDYRALMREEVTSTRTRFDDFRRKFKKDRRFWAFGRDDREREKAFKVHLRELGERKRADAERAEKDFLELLSETHIAPEAEWSQVKRGISHDSRYDAVGSSSLRAELFATHLKKLAAEGNAEDPATRRAREKKERQEASLAQRQNAVRAHQAVIGEEASKARRSAGREEGERLFGSLLVDVVRSDTTWEDILPILRQDRRFAHPALRDGDRRRLLEGHVERIRETKADELSSLFARHAKLETTFGDIYEKIADDALVQRLGLGAAALEERFNAWRRARETVARAEFYDLLRENNFVEFWGRMRNKVLDDAATKVKQDEDEVEEGMDVTALAKQVDLAEIKAILRRDQRYRQFDHVGDEREMWLREYLENLEGSTGTETIHKIG